VNVSRDGAHVRAPAEIASDPRKSIVFSVGSFNQAGPGEGSNAALFGEVRMNPRPNIELSLGPSLSWDKSEAQFLGRVADPLAANTFGARYIFANVDQTTISLDTRLNMAFNAETSFELFAQPFLSSGDYGNLKELAMPRSFDFVRYGIDGGTQTSITGGRFEIDPDGVGSARAFRVDDKDFNFRSLRANAVFRWEWRPGSTLFLVWQQSRAGRLVVNGLNDQVGDFDLGRDSRALFEIQPDNIFMIKVNYWLNP
jgi:hypothetical protein